MILTQNDYVILFVTSFTIVSFFTPFMKFIAIKLNMMDVPNLERKTQKTAVPYLGGIAIVVGVTLTTYGAILLGDVSSQSLWLATSVLGPAIIMAITGVVDDLVPMTPKFKLFWQALAAISATFILIITRTVSLVDSNWFISTAISTVWIVGLINAVNFFDNHDGASTSAIAITSFFIFLIAINGTQYFIASLAIVICAATFSFYFWNKPDAKIYMGDAGALYLGILIASLTIRLRPAEISQTNGIFVALMLVSVFLLDSSVAIVSRIQRGINPMLGGKDHLSHRLMRIGRSKAETTHILQILTAFFGSFALATLLTSSLVINILYISSFILLFFFFYSIPHEDR